MAIETKPKANHRAMRRHYQAALGKAEKAVLDAAREAEGFDDEVAVLRVKLLSLLKPDGATDLELLMKGVRLLVQAASARYRISGAGEERLAESINGVLNGLGAVLLSGDDDGDGR